MEAAGVVNGPGSLLAFLPRASAKPYWTHFFFHQSVQNSLFFFFIITTTSYQTSRIWVTCGRLNTPHIENQKVRQESTSEGQGANQLRFLSSKHTVGLRMIPIAGIRISASATSSIFAPQVSRSVIRRSIKALWPDLCCVTKQDHSHV